MRLFFLKSYAVPLEGGGQLVYSAGYFYQVDDVSHADAFVDSGVAETEEQHVARLEQEEADRLAASAPAPEA